MRYQFQIDNRPAGPIRNEILDAFQDAVNDGYAIWENGQRCAIRMEQTQGGAIARLPDAKKMEPPTGAAPVPPG